MRHVLRDGVVSCRLTERVGDVYERVKTSPFRFALVLAENGCLLGRLRASSLEQCDPGSSAEEVMEPGPSTVRPDTELSGLVQRLRERDLMFAIATNPEGRLMGVVRRSEAESYLSGRQD